MVLRFPNTRNCSIDKMIIMAIIVSLQVTCCRLYNLKALSMPRLLLLVELSLSFPEEEDSYMKVEYNLYTRTTQATLKYNKSLGESRSLHYSTAVRLQLKTNQKNGKIFVEGLYYLVKHQNLKDNVNWQPKRSKIKDLPRSIISEAQFAASILFFFFF